MAKRKKEAEAEAVATPVAPIQQLDTLPGETYGLAVTSPTPAPVNESVTETYIEVVESVPDEPEYAAPVVASDISSDPNVSVAATLLALGRLRNDAVTVSGALSTWLRTTAGEPELHAFLMRMQTLIGDFRHSFEQIEGGISERLNDAIHEALAA